MESRYKMCLYDARRNNLWRKLAKNSRVSVVVLETVRDTGVQNQLKTIRACWT